MGKPAHNRLTIEYVRDAFIARGYKLLATEYMNNRQRLEFICPRGHNGTIAWGEFNNGANCVYCHREDSNEKRRLNQEDVEKFFEDHGLKLISEYRTHNGQLTYICDKGHVAITSLSNLKRALRTGKNGCGECKRSFVIETASKYEIRTSQVYFKMAKYVRERDNFECVACGKHGGKLHVHHLNSFTDFPDERLDPNNCVTLCIKCHNVGYEGSFHNIFGCYHNTKEQFEEYLKIKKGVVYM